MSPLLEADIKRIATGFSRNESVYIADAATFSPLPAKNHSFTMMANAMRVAERGARTA